MMFVSEKWRTVVSAEKDIKVWQPEDTGQFKGSKGTPPAVVLLSASLLRMTVFAQICSVFRTNFCWIYKRFESKGSSYVRPVRPGPLYPCSDTKSHSASYFWFQKNGIDMTVSSTETYFSIPSRSRKRGRRNSVSTVFTTLRVSGSLDTISPSSGSFQEIRTDTISTAPFIIFTVKAKQFKIEQSS